MRRGPQSIVWHNVRMSTPAVAALERAKTNFVLHVYDTALLDETLSYGEAVAAQLGVSPDRLLKTLVTEVEGVPTIGIVPVASSLDLKAFAKAAGGKRAVMASAAVAERSTGYVTGGISPFGQRKRLPFVVDASVLDHASVWVSGGKRGLQIELAPQALVKEVAARVARISTTTGRK